MTQNLTIFVMTASISALFLTTVSMICAVLALAKVYALKNSTHQIIQGPWNKMPTAEEPEYVNEENEEDGSASNSPTYNEDDIQDLPIGMRAPKPLSLKEQMAKHMYPSIEDEQV